MGKKAQVETMGLVIIVLLLAFIALIFLRYSGEPIESQDKYLSIKINNFLISLSKIDIGNDNFESLAIDCCSGIESNCQLLAEKVEDHVNYLEVNLSDFHFELSCFSDYGGFIVGDCINGVASGSLFLITSDEISAKICRKD